MYIFMRSNDNCNNILNTKKNSNITIYKLVIILWIRSMSCYLLQLIELL